MDFFYFLWKVCEFRLYFDEITEKRSWFVSFFKNYSVKYRKSLKLYWNLHYSMIITRNMLIICVRTCLSCRWWVTNVPNSFIFSGEKTELIAWNQCSLKLLVYFLGNICIFIRFSDFTTIISSHLVLSQQISAFFDEKSEIILPNHGFLLFTRYWPSVQVFFFNQNCWKYKMSVSSSSFISDFCCCDLWKIFVLCDEMWLFRNNISSNSLISRWKYFLWLDNDSKCNLYTFLSDCNNFISMIHEYSASWLSLSMNFWQIIRFLLILLQFFS